MSLQDDGEEFTQPGFFSLADLSLFYGEGQSAEDSKRRAFQLMQMLNSKVDALRVSLVHCPNETQAFVLASSDDEHVAGLPINLTKYPEICEARKTKRSVVISDIYRSELLLGVLKRLSKTPFEAIVTIPIEKNGSFFGTLCVRMKSKTPTELSFVETLGVTCSQIIAISGMLEARPAVRKAG